VSSFSHFKVLVFLSMTLVLVLIFAPPAVPALAACDPDAVITRVSVASDGTQGNEVSNHPILSANGRYIAFESKSSNLVPGDTNNQEDVFVYDRQTCITTRVSVASDGTQQDTSESGYHTPDISADGRYVVFASLATNLVSNDTNNARDVFMHDRQTGETVRVSVASGYVQSNAYSFSLSISADGRYIAFASDATNLVVGDTNNQADVFVHDRQTGETVRVSIASDGTQGNGFSAFSDISSDGQYVIFASDADNLVVGDTNNARDVFIHNRQTGQTSRVSVASDGTQGNDLSSYQTRPSISGDGRYVVFVSLAYNLVPGDTNDTSDIFVKDTQTGQISRVSVGLNNTESDGGSFIVAANISQDGRFVTYESDAAGESQQDEL
jgi:Tol biopolymer transport system component